MFSFTFILLATMTTHYIDSFLFNNIPWEFGLQHDKNTFKNQTYQTRDRLKTKSKSIKNNNRLKQA